MSDDLRTAEAILRAGGFTEAADYLVKNTLTREDLAKMSPQEIAELDPKIVQALTGPGRP